MHVCHCIPGASSATVNPMSDNIIRVPVTMPVDMLTFLEDSSLRAKVTGGRKLANTVIIRAAVRHLMELGVDFSGCRDEEDVLAMIKRTHCQNEV